MRRFNTIFFARKKIANSFGTLHFLFFYLDFFLLFLRCSIIFFLQQSNCIGDRNCRSKKGRFGFTYIVVVVVRLFGKLFSLFY